MKKMTKCQLLKMNFGGEWHYIPFVGWYSDDDRSVHYVSSGVDEFDKPLPGLSRCCLYGHGACHYFYWYQLEGDHQ